MGFCSRQLFNSIFVIQKRALRFMCRVRAREHCRLLFVKHGILTSLLVLETVCQIHKTACDGISDCSHNTRLSEEQRLRLPMPQSILVRGSIVYEGLKIYNHLDRKYRLMKYPQFRRGVKSVLLTRSYYILKEYCSDSLQCLWSSAVLTNFYGCTYF